MPEPQPDCHDVEEAQEASGRLVVARGDAPGILEAGETSLV